jgi:sirohydrochlorin ferrochelatase
MNGLPEPVAVVPLFLTDGLLLTSVRELATQRGWQMAEPLGERAAKLVLLRYTQTRLI